MRLRTRKHEGRLSCSVVAVSNKPNPLKPALPKPRSGYVRKPESYSPAQSRQTCYGRLGKTKW